MRTTAGRPQAIIIFSDIRGFSQWSRDIDAYESTIDLVNSFQEMLKRHFDGYWMKPLGDGAMLAKLAQLGKQEEIEAEIDRIVELMAQVEQEFGALTRQIEIRSGNKTNMLLGWGVTRGNVLRL